MDVLTDLSVLSSEFSSRKIVIDPDPDPDPDPERASPSPSPSPSSSDAFVFSEGQQAKKLLVHAGFLLAFESLVKEIVSILLLLLLLLFSFFHLEDIIVF